MNVKSLFAGGIPGETYGEGVRRRIKSAAIIWALALVALIVTASVFLVSASIWATLGAATLCGIVSSRADIGIDPIKGEPAKASDKIIWLMLFVPALGLLGSASVYVATHVRDGFDVFKAAVTAGLFGWVLGFTMIILFDLRPRNEAARRKP